MKIVHWDAMNNDSSREKDLRQKKNFLYLSLYEKKLQNNEK